MNYSELKAGLNAVLQTVFPIVSDDPAVQTYNYYGLEVIEGYTTPCFFTRLEVGESRVENKSTIYNRMTYHIQYEPSETDEIDMLSKADAIRDLFLLGVKVQDRTVDMKSFDFGFTGTDRDVLEISVDVEYLSDIRKPETAEIMRDAQVNFNYKEE